MVRYPDQRRNARCTARRCSRFVRRSGRRRDRGGWGGTCGRSWLDVHLGRRPGAVFDGVDRPRRPAQGRNPRPRTRSPGVAEGGRRSTTRSIPGHRPYRLIERVRHRTTGGQKFLPYDRRCLVDRSPRRAGGAITRTAAGGVDAFERRAGRESTPGLGRADRGPVSCGRRTGFGTDRARYAACPSPARRPNRVQKARGGWSGALMSHVARTSGFSTSSPVASSGYSPG